MVISVHRIRQILWGLIPTGCMPDGWGLNPSGPESFECGNLKKHSVVLPQGVKRVWTNVHDVITKENLLKDCLELIDIVLMQKQLTVTDFITFFGANAEVIAWRSCATDTCGEPKKRLYPVLKINRVAQKPPELVICWNWVGNEVSEPITVYLYP